MKPALIVAALGLLLLAESRHYTATNINSILVQSRKQQNGSLSSSKNVDTTESLHGLEKGGHLAKVIDLEEIYSMSIGVYVKRRARQLWDYLIHGSPEEPQSTFAGRCLGIAKTVRQLIPMAMIGGGIIVTKLAFLVLFSLKTIGLVGLLLLLNVATVAGKLGAYLSSKKSEHVPQNVHVHVQPWKGDDHVYSSSHYEGPPYGWEDKLDKSDVVHNIESHELYNLYEKLEFENRLRRYLASGRQAP